MNILVLEEHASSSFGGAERSMRRLCEHLAGEHEMSIAYVDAGDYVSDPELSALYSHRLHLPTTLPFRPRILAGWMTSISRLVWFIWSRQIDVILTHVVHAAPLLRVVHMLTGVPYRYQFKWVGSMDDVGLQARWGMRGVDLAAPIANYVADYWIRNGVDEASVTVVPEGVDYYKKKEVDRDTSVLNIGFAGRLVADKGLHLLVEAGAMLRNEGVEYTLNIAGSFVEGQFRDLPEQGDSKSYQLYIENMIKKEKLNEYIKFWGYVDSLLPWLERMDVVVLPSTCQEAQNLVMMEAMATGTPVIVSEVGGMKEIHQGDFDRWLIIPNKAEAVKEALMTFSELSIQEKKRVGLEMREHVRRNYTLEDHYSRIKQALCLDE